MRLFLFPLAVALGAPGAISAVKPAPDQVGAPASRPLAALALPYGIGPQIGERAAWAALPLDRAQILAAAKTELGQPVPAWGETEYLAYFETGSREPHGVPFRRRLYRSGLFPLAAGLSNDERFVAAAAREISAILDEPTWVIPAHDTKNQDNLHGRITDIDLGVTMRAWNLVTAAWILGDRLDPALVARLRTEVHRRSVAPYLRRLDGDTSLCKWVWWQGNWNAVCHAGIVGAALFTSPDRTEVERIVAGMRATIEKSFHGHASDGYCSEGIMYHNYGFGHYANLAEMLYRASAGGIDLFADPRIREIAAFPTRFEVFGQMFPAFADTPYGSRAVRGLQAMLATRLDDATLLPPALRARPENASYGIGNLLYDTLLIATTPPPPALESAEWAPRHEFTEGGVLIVRPLAPGDTTLGAAFKGGHNAELHNHNDVGAYAIAVGDSFPVTDVGSEVYNKNTFGTGRYDSPINNSRGHSVPIIDGHLQREGRAAAARVLHREFTPERDVWVIDLTSCYDAPNLVSLHREYRYHRGADACVEIIDRVEFREPGTYANAFMTLGSWTQRTPRTLAFTHGRNTLVADLDASTAFTLSEDTLDGQNLGGGRRATRVGLEFSAPVQRGELHVTFRPEAR